MDIAVTSVQHRKTLFLVYEIFTYSEPICVSSFPVLTWFVSRHIRLLYMTVKKQINLLMFTNVIDLLSKHCDHLISLDLEQNIHLTTGHMKNLCLGNEARTLRDINVSRCKTVDDRLFEILSDHYCSLPRTRNISRSLSPSSNSCRISISISISSSSSSSSSYSTSQSTLNSLRIAHCSKITSIGLLSFLHTPVCNSLQLLDVSGCAFVTDPAVASIAESCGSTLRSLYLNKCVHITDTALEHLTKSCHRLHTLSVQFCGHITDSGVEQLTFSCGTQLQALHLSECMSITDGSILAIAKSCDASNLRALSLVGCLNISQTSIRILKKAVPSLCPQV